MKIETKFDIGESCYVIHNNKIEKCTVKSISILITGSEEYKEEYSLEEIKMDGYNFHPYFTELFKTKEELIQSL